ncbi:hypothetical protein ABT364_12610 [Massilia sp. SR12]
MEPLTIPAHAAWSHPARRHLAFDPDADLVCGKLQQVLVVGSEIDLCNWREIHIKRAESQPGALERFAELAAATVAAGPCRHKIKPVRLCPAALVWR